MCTQVVNARSKEGTELAVVKLYAVLSQAHFVKQQAADWEGAFLGILALPLPLLLTNLANVLAAKNPVHSKVVQVLLMLHNYVYLLLRSEATFHMHPN